MDFTTVINERYSCKKYSNAPVDREALTKILEAGRVAPSAMNLQNQIIYVLESEEMLKIVDEVTPCRYGAPTVLVVAFDKSKVYKYPGGKKNSGAEDMAIVATQMMLAAYNEGVDSCWLNHFDPEELERKMNLPKNEEIVMMLDLGHAADGAGALPNHFSRKPLAETVKFL